MAIAVLALATGAVAMGALTSPDPEAATPTSTTTTSTTTPLDRPIDYDNFTVDQIATGEQFQWSQVAEVSDGWGASLVSQLGLLYLFTSSRTLPNGDPAGLHAYRTFDAAHWEDLGEVVSSDGYFFDVAATPFGLMAVSPEPSDGSLAVWRSTDAIHWDRMAIEQTGSRVGLTFFSQALGASNALVVVAGTSFEDGSPLLQARLRERGIDLDLTAIGWTVVPGDGELRVVLYGPLGIPAMSIEAAKLGLTDEDVQTLQGRSIGSIDAQAWSSSDGVNWSSTTIEGARWISSVIPAPDGGILVFGEDSSGSAMWRTFNGVDFEKLPFMLRADRAKPWRGGFAGLRSSGNPPDVMVSPDGETWQRSGLAEGFPQRFDWAWYSSRFATGEAGIAVTVTGTPRRLQSRDERTPPVLRHDGFSLTLDFEQGVMYLDDGESTRSWQLWNYTDVIDNLAVDLGEETIAFLDPSGNPQVTFTFDEIESARMAYAESYAADETVHALAFSDNGTTWSIQDLDKAFADQVEVVSLAVTPFSLVAVTRPSTPTTLTADHEALQIWSAPLPGR